MARIFISHSSRNAVEAAALRDWLVAEGWHDLFLDLDPERGILAGERWESALYQAANRCEAVVLLISRAWLDSPWCRREFDLSRKLNKRVFAVLVEDIPIEDIPVDLAGTWQLINLAAGADHLVLRSALPDGREAHTTFSQIGLRSLRAGLTKAGLDARFFAWPPDDDPHRAPYRGLKPLEAEDAGIFFGREAPTVEVLDRLRGLKEAAPPRLLAIIGASGAGKSSFLRAGVLPRLARDDRHFFALPIMRPARAALTGDSGLVHALTVAFERLGRGRSRAQVADAVNEGATAVNTLLDDLVDRARSEPGAGAPMLVLPVDQAEELFLPDGVEEARAFLHLARRLSSDARSRLIVVMTVRSDSFELLQTTPELDGLPIGAFSLPPLPRGAYQQVIEGPAVRLRHTARPLTIEPSLTAALLADVEAGASKDALPLLAFTLERLYLEHGGDGDLKLAEYLETGGIKGSIEAAVLQALKAADEDPRVPRDRAARLALLRRALIPWLAGIDAETGAPRRRVARLSEIPEEARPLVDHLVSARLLSTDLARETGEQTIEPAHECLLRQWGLLQGWLEEDFGALTTLEGVKRAARDWAANDEDEGWLTHAAGRLEDAEALVARADIVRFLDPTDRAYLRRCRTLETARRDRELEEARKLAAAQAAAAEHQRQVSRRTRMGLVAASVLASIAAGLAVVASNRAGEAERLAERALRSETVALASMARALAGQGRHLDATRLALAAWPRESSADRPPLLATVQALSAALPRFRDPLRSFAASDATYSAFSPDGALLLLASRGGGGRLFDVRTGLEIGVLDAAIHFAAFSRDSTRLAILSSVDGGRSERIRVWDAAGNTIAAFTPDNHPGVVAAAFSPDNTRLVTASHDRTSRVFESATGAEVLVLSGHQRQVTSAAYSPDGTRIATASFDGTARIWDARTGSPLRLFDHDSGSEYVYAAAFSPDGTRLATATSLGARIWDLATGAAIATLPGSGPHVTAAAFSPDGERVVTASLDGRVRTWSASGAPGQELDTGGGTIHSVAFSTDGADLLVASTRSASRLAERFGLVPVTEFKAHDRPVTSVAFSPDEARILTRADRVAAWETAAWDVLTGAPLERRTERDPDHPLNRPVEKMDRLSFSPPARDSALATSPDGTRRLQPSGRGIRVLNTATAEEVALRLESGESVASAVFSLDGARVFTASTGGTVRIWDTATGTQIGLLVGQDGTLNCAASSPDGTRIALASDGSTAVFDASLGVRLLELGRGAAEVTAARFSADGTRLVTGSVDGRVAVWDLSRLETGDGVDVACARLRGDTDLAELRSRYALDALAPICEGRRLSVDWRSLE